LLQHGFSFVEMLIVVAVTVTVFGGLFLTLEHALKVVGVSRAKTSALSIANDRMEYFRSLPYDDVGTVSGIPPGVIPQLSTTTLNGIEFTERVLVEYVDDPADGMLTATTTDSNGIPADYKRIKIEVSWTRYGSTDNIAIVSNIVPRSIETTDGGGTVRINVIDDQSLPLSGAAVTLINNTTTTTISVTKYSDVTGTVLFSGAPAASGYEVEVTKTGYSTDGTYAPSVANPNPTTAPFSVLEADISTLTFQIGALSDVDIITYDDVTDGETLEWFDDSSGIASSTDSEVVSGELRLAQSGGVYSASGMAYLTAIAPTPLERWEAVTIAGSAPSGASYKAHIYTLEVGGYVLVPDTEITGNSTGFTGPIISLQGLSAGTYPTIVVGIELTTSDSSVTPAVDAVEVFYRESSATKSGVTIDAHGIKVIGSDASAAPIYKTTISGTTDGSGEYSVTDVEFDTYDFDFSSYTVSRSCPTLPLQHLAGVDSVAEITLISSGTDTLLVTVLSDAGERIPGASVELSRSGFSDTVRTNACGQAFFSAGVSANTDYVVDVSKSGFQSVTVSPYDLSNESGVIVNLTEL
jgi:hypothetical protein